MEEEKCTVESEADIKAYRQKKRNDTRREWRKKKAAENPNYYHDLHQRYKKSDIRYHKKRDRMSIKAMPKGISEDIREWIRRRCMNYGDVANTLGVKESYVKMQINRSVKMSVRLLRLCGFDYNHTKPPLKYKRRYRPFKRGQSSICMECKNISCSWMKDKIPVEGWKADFSQILGNGKTINTFSVMACPEYDDEEYSCYGSENKEDGEMDE